MKTRILGLYILLACIIAACSDPLDNSLNSDDLAEIKEYVVNNDGFSEMEKKFINDNLEEAIGFANLGRAFDMGDSDIPTFREYISELSIEYDSIRTEKIKIRDNNQKINELVNLIDANTIGIDRNRGYLNLTLELNNQFDKDILYVILNYNYTDRYDRNFFDENVRLTDEVAGDFSGEVDVSINEEYNRVSQFIWSEVPVKARQALRDEFGEDEADAKVQKDFLMAGLKIQTLGIVFTDRSELTPQNAEWAYFEN